MIHCLRRCAGASERLCFSAMDTGAATCRGAPQEKSEPASTDGSGTVGVDGRFSSGAAPQSSGVGVAEEAVGFRLPPHSGQKTDSSGISVPQCLQYIVSLLYIDLRVLLPLECVKRAEAFRALSVPFRPAHTPARNSLPEPQAALGAGNGGGPGAFCFPGASRPSS